MDPLGPDDGDVSGVALGAAARGNILRRTQDARPREACGLLIGHLDGSLALVQEATLARNLAQGEDSFRVHPEDHMAAEVAAQEAGAAVIGAWHSHPAGPPLPSERDRRGALPGWIQLIAGVGPEGYFVTAWAPRGDALRQCELK